jgi:cytochrome c oxidase subunit 4
VQEGQEHSLIKARTYTAVFAGLLILTVVTIAVARMELGRFSVLTALVVASIKASLVLLFFMHLKYEKRFFIIMFVVAIVFLTVAIGITFFDIAYR